LKWRGQSWPDAVLYELHVGNLRRKARLPPHARDSILQDLGVTALQIMPLAISGQRNWLRRRAAIRAGVLLRRTCDLKALIDGGP